jgi:hypothetical protein
MVEGRAQTAREAETNAMGRREGERRDQKLYSEGEEAEVKRASDKF